MKDPRKIRTSILRTCLEIYCEFDKVVTKALHRLVLLRQQAHNNIAKVHCTKRNVQNTCGTKWSSIAHVLIFNYFRLLSCPSFATIAKLAVVHNFDRVYLALSFDLLLE